MPKKILGLIPARGGSKGIANKNIVPLAGLPLVAYSIKSALNSQCFDRVVVSTDDRDIADISVQHGAEAPFFRPPDLATDSSGALEVIQHTVHKLKELDDWRPDWIVYLQPTSPLRSAESIRSAVEKMSANDADSLVSIIRVPHQFSLESQLTLKNDLLSPAIPGKVNLPRRQDKEVRYARNGPAILILRYETAVNMNSLYGESVLPFEMPTKESIDIDCVEDLKFAEWLMSN